MWKTTSRVYLSLNFNGSLHGVINSLMILTPSKELQRMTQSGPRHTKPFTENSYKLPFAFSTPVVPTLPPFEDLLGTREGSTGSWEREKHDGGKKDIPHSAMEKH